MCSFIISPSFPMSQPCGVFTSFHSSIFHTPEYSEYRVQSTKCRDAVHFWIQYLANQLFSLLRVVVFTPVLTVLCSVSPALRFSGEIITRLLGASRALQLEKLPSLLSIPPLSCNFPYFIWSFYYSSTPQVCRWTTYHDFIVVKVKQLWLLLCGSPVAVHMGILPAGMK